MKDNGKKEQILQRKLKVGGQPLSEKTEKELRFRLNLVKGALHLLRNDLIMKDDYRQPTALKIYQGQAKTLRDEIGRRFSKPVKIELETAKLTKEYPNG